MITKSDYVHFVSEPQAEDFAGLSLVYRVIPNSFVGFEQHGGETQPLAADVGMVGYFDRPAKNLRGMQTVMHSLPDLKAVVWGSLPVDFTGDPQLLLKGFSTDKWRIFSSFRVFLSLSEDETFGMVVIQAMSAGLPCVLSNIPAFQEYRECPGVYLVEPDNTAQITQAVKAALQTTPERSAEIVKFWRSRYSPAAVRDMWLDYIHEIVGTQGE
ncbi:MAG: hypothetical protein Cons2KO_30150 [Congregibacter sp.]